VTSSRSAAGEEVGWMLRALGRIAGEGRRARYVSELVAITPLGEEYRGTGTLTGKIAEEPSGTGGFGFDPVFVPDGEQRTVAELGDAWKAQHSHRANAAHDLLRQTG
jgi:XTP/dITP diphosphohydrolase